jgi:hypothetical protein
MVNLRDNTHLAFGGSDCCDGNAEEDEMEELLVCEKTAWVEKDEQSSVVLVFGAVKLFEMLLMAVLLPTKRLAT